jgi:hypothetical protein
MITNADDKMIFMDYYNQLNTLALSYFNAFANKDINALSNLLADDVILFDPIIQEVKSKKLVLEANQNIFAGVQKIFFEQTDIFIDVEKSAIIGQLKINFDGKIIDVVDIIIVNQSQLISKITAYLDSKQVQ